MTSDDRDEPAPPRAAERVVVDASDPDGMAAALAAPGARQDLAAQSAARKDVGAPHNH